MIMITVDNLKRKISRLAERISNYATVEGVVQNLSTLHETTKGVLVHRLGGLPQNTHSLEPGGATLNIQQMWRHNESGRIFRITSIQMGAVHRPADAVTAWVPEKIHWEDTQDQTSQGSMVVYFWRKFMTELTAEEDGIQPGKRIFALLNKQGTAMAETALREYDFTPANQARIKADPPADWDGGDFWDVTLNDAVQEALGA